MCRLMSRSTQLSRSAWKKARVHRVRGRSDMMYTSRKPELRRLWQRPPETPASLWFAQPRRCLCCVLQCYSLSAQWQVLPCFSTGQLQTAEADTCFHFLVRHASCLPSLLTSSHSLTCSRILSHTLRYSHNWQFSQVVHLCTAIGANPHAFDDWLALIKQAVGPAWNNGMVASDIRENIATHGNS